MVPSFEALKSFKGNVTGSFRYSTCAIRLFHTAAGLFVDKQVNYKLRLLYIQVKLVSLNGGG